MKPTSHLIETLRVMTHSRNHHQLAMALGVGTSTISRMNKGETKLSLVFIQRAHKFAGMRLETLFEYLPDVKKGAGCHRMSDTFL